MNTFRGVFLLNASVHDHQMTTASFLGPHFEVYIDILSSSKNSIY